jgi:glycosyltransferase involved in cell wall biosynthesis
MKEYYDLIIYVDTLKPAGGIERVIVNIANNLSNQMRLAIVIKNRDDIFYPINSNVEIIYLTDSSEKIGRLARLWNIYKYSRILSKKLCTIDAKKIYVSNQINLLEIIFSSFPTRRIIVSEHGSNNHLHWFFRIIKRITYPYVFSCVVPTHEDTLNNKKYTEKVKYIPHHLTDFDAFRKLPTKSNIILNVGRLTSDKNQIELLRIFQNINNPDWKLIIIGDGELEVDLRKFIYQNKINAEIHSSTKDIAYYYAQAKVFALTSISEGYGMVLIESLVFGLPIIAYDCPVGPREIIINGENGYLIGNFDRNKYIEKLTELMNDEHLLKNASIRAKDSVKRWSHSVINQEWIKLIND